jgi:predicted PurR-regulated permease PerM
MKSPFASAGSTLFAIALLAVAMVWAMRDLALLVGYAVLLAYALLPVVRAIERLRDPRGRALPRGVVAGAVMFTLVVIAVWMVVLVVPPLAGEAVNFAGNVPALLDRIVESISAYAVGHDFAQWFAPALERARDELPALARGLGGSMTNGATGIFSGIGHLLGLALLPLLAFYLLAESDAVQVSALKFIPEASRPDITRLGGAVDRALRSYVRGQAIVCLVTGVSVCAGLALVHHPVALLLGLLAGAAEVIPYVGFLVVVVAIALAGSSVGPWQMLLGLAVYVGLNWTIGTFVTPRLMGRYLRMHPFVVTVSVLAGAQLLGAAGALLALPVAAVVQALIGELAPARTGASAARPAPAPPPGA